MKMLKMLCVVMAFTILYDVCSAGDYSNRKYLNEINSMNPLSYRIVDVDCEYDAGKFILRSLPLNLPGLFTIRFTAPADYTQGDVIVVNGKELPVRTPGMASASSGLFNAGAVLRCDMDMDRELAFFWQGGDRIGGMPNLSYAEQFAGFYDEDGKPVYIKTVDFGMLSNRTVKQVAHGIANIRSIVDLNVRYGDSTIFFNENRTNVTLYNLFYATKANIVFEANGNASMYSAKVTMYYTCTDR